MALAAVEGSDCLWFVMSDDSPKAAELRADPRVSAKGVKYVFQAVKSVLAGERPAPVEGQHARIKAPPDREVASSRR